jgi:hypothetical protein
MPMNNAQLAGLVNRAKLKAPPVVSPPSPSPAAQRPVRARQTTPTPQTPSTARTTPKARTPTPSSKGPVAPPALSPPSPAPAPQPEHTAETTMPDDFPIGWELKKDSWHFHRRFYAIFKRPMHRGEYSHLLWQIRRAKAEHLVEDCWRVTLPNGRSLAVCGNVWKLITILPKNWQPPTVVE